MANDILAAPEYLLIRDELLLVRPLSEYSKDCLAAWVRFASDGKCKTLADPKAEEYLATAAGAAQQLYLSTRTTSKLSLKDICLLLDGEDCTRVQNFIVELNTPSDEFYEQYGKEMATDAPIPTFTEEAKATLYYAIARRFKYTIDQISALTMVQQAIFINRINNRSDDGGLHFDTPEEYLAWKAQNK